MRTIKNRRRRKGIYIEEFKLAVHMRRVSFMSVWMIWTDARKVAAATGVTIEETVDAVLRKLGLLLLADFAVLAEDIPSDELEAFKALGLLEAAPEPSPASQSGSTLVQ